MIKIKNLSISVVNSKKFEKYNYLFLSQLSQINLDKQSH